MRLVDRRIGFLFGLFLLSLLAIGMRAWWLDTVKASSLRSRALSQQTERLTLPAKRGTIFDRNGKVLAISEDSSTIYADPLLIKNPGAVATRLSALLHLPDERAAGEALATARRASSTSGARSTWTSGQRSPS